MLPPPEVAEGLLRLRAGVLPASPSVLVDAKGARPAGDQGIGGKAAAMLVSVSSQAPAPIDGSRQIRDGSSEAAVVSCSRSDVLSGTLPGVTCGMKPALAVDCRLIMQNVSSRNECPRRITDAAKGVLARACGIP